MIDLLNFVNKILAVGTIILQIFVVLALVCLVLPYKKKKVDVFIVRNGIMLSFAVAFIATAGSLFYSGYAGFVPCTLCWFQRIFMYPLVILLGLALIKKEDKIIDYSLALSVVGFVISVYHNFIYFQGLHSVVCTSAESCATPYVTEFGYITIPVMAMTAFAMIILILSIKRWKKTLEN